MMSERTRNRIIEQAIACIALNNTAGLEEIAEAAGVGRATLYRHFKSRADLLTELKLSAGQRLQAAWGPFFESDQRARDKLVGCVGVLVPLGASLNVSSYFCKPIRRDEDPRVLENYENHLFQVRQLCLDLKAEGSIAGDAPVTWLVTALTSLVFAAWENVESGNLAPKQAPWLVLETFIGGHGAPETRTWFNELKESNQ